MIATLSTSNPFEWDSRINGAVGFIHAAGRNEYLKEGHENFVRIIHDYQDDGFAKWEKQIEQLLDENG